MAYRYRVVEDCWRTDIGPVARKFVEGEEIEVPFEINSPKFHRIGGKASSGKSAPAQAEKLDPAVAALNKKIAAANKKG